MLVSGDRRVQCSTKQSKKYIDPNDEEVDEWKCALISKKCIVLLASIGVCQTQGFAHCDSWLAGLFQVLLQFSGG